jgi:ABC-type molybdate transport system permease subunit
VAGNDALAYRWAALNLAISFCFLMVINLMERRDGGRQEKEGPAWR